MLFQVAMRKILQLGIYLFLVVSVYSQQTNSTPALKQCGCGKELLPRHQFCAKCAKERERHRKREYRHKKKEAELEFSTSTPKENILRCKTENCERERKYGHGYCDRCAKQRKRERDRIKKRKKRNKKTTDVPLLGPGKTAILNEKHRKNVANLGC